MKPTNREATEGRRKRMEGPQLAQIDLSEERKRVRLQDGWDLHGHAATTLFKYPGIGAVLMGFKPGTRVRQHQSEGRIQLLCLSGQVRIHAMEQVIELTAGRILLLERLIPHDLEATQESDVLVTVTMTTTSEAS